MKFIGSLILTLFLTGVAQGQTCTGNFGDAVVNLDFGSGSNPGPISSTNYTYTTSKCPNDGSYTITSNTPGCFGNNWHNVTQDHTPDDSNGLMMLVNASNSPGEFFKQSIDNLCPGTTYEFAAYVMNVLRPSAAGIKPNLTFIIESADGTSLGKYSTGNIIESAAPEWKKHALIFTTLPGISQIILKIINNAPGGNGNDLALDDITFRACGPTIQPTVNGSQESFSVCEGQSSTISLEANVSSGLSNPAYQWQVNQNNSGWKDIPGANSKTSAVLLTPVAGAVYQYRLAVAESLNINSIKCRILSEPVSAKLTLNPSPKVDFEVPDFCLADGSAQFTNTTTISDGTEAQLTYSWDFGDAALANTQRPNTSTLKNPSHRYTKAGRYTVKLTVKSANGCEKTISKPFVVNGGVPKAAFSVKNPDLLCSDKSVEFEDNVIVELDEEVTKIEWIYDLVNFPNAKEIDDTPAMRASPSRIYPHKYPAFTSPASKTYQVRMLAYTGGTCVNTITKSVTVLAVPNVQFDVIPDICSDSGPIQLTQAKEIHGVLTGTGTYTGKGVTPTGSFNQAIAGVGTHTLTYTFVADNGCTDFKTQTITVNEIPTATIIPKLIVLDGGRIKLPAVATGNNLTYKWTPSTYLDKDDILIPVTTPTDDITYTLTVTTDKGCMSTTQIFIKVLKFPEVPNSFTPNGDGVNDTWNVKYLESYPDAMVHIFNRYGEKLFQIVNYLTPWDGTKNGSDLPVGTYYYIINPRNGRKIISGSVTIIR